MFNPWLTVELAATLVQSYIVVRFTHDFLGGSRDAKTDRVAMCIMWLLFAAATTLANYITYYEGPAIIIFAMLLFAYSTLFLGGEWYNKMIASVVPILCISSTTSPLFRLISIVFSEHPYAVLTEPGIPRLLLLIMAQLILFYLLFAILKFSKKDKVHLTKTESLLIILVLLVSIVLFTLIDLVVLSHTLSLNASYYLLLCILGLVVINIVTLYLVSQVSAKNAITVQNELLHQQLAYQEQYSEMVGQQYQSTRRIRHDLKQSLTVLGMLIAQGDYEKAEQHLNEYIGTELSGLSSVNTLNETLNAILNIKLVYARSHGIETTCMVQEGFDLLNGTEICNVFGNLLDNAIEYCKRFPDMENGISVKIKQEDNRCVILVANKLHGSVLEVNSELKTTKQDNELHGMGIESVRQIINKHDGLFNCYEDGGMFCARIILFL